MTGRYKWSSGMNVSMQDSEGDVLSPAAIVARMNDQAECVAKLNEICDLAMRLKDIDMGDCHHVDPEVLEDLISLALDHLIDSSSVDSPPPLIGIQPLLADREVGL